MKIQSNDSPLLTADVHSQTGSCFLRGKAKTLEESYYQSGGAQG
jgi:hypothetical protein